MFAWVVAEGDDKDWVGDMTADHHSDNLKLKQRSPHIILKLKSKTPTTWFDVTDSLFNTLIKPNSIKIILLNNNQ